jgi:hypothetical protein
MTLTAPANRPSDVEPGLLGRVWRSIVRGPIRPRTDRDRKWIVFNNFVLHFRPVRVPAKTLSYTHTFGLGGMSLVLVLLLISTGVLMMFGYEPSPEGAYASVLGLERDVLFGRLVRSVHHWSANFLIAVVVLHLLRVYFTNAYHAPRQFNWVLGLGLLVCVLASNFTGYLLPWDQLSYWAVTISTGMIGYVPLAGEWLQRVVRGGPEIGRATLITFYTLHTTIVPVTIVLLMGFHFWRVRKARGVVVPRAPGEPMEESPEKVLGLPYLLLRELVVGLILVAFVMVFAALVAAPLGEAANPGMSPNPGHSGAAAALPSGVRGGAAPAARHRGLVADPLRAVRRGPVGHLVRFAQGTAAGAVGGVAGRRACPAVGRARRVRDRFRWVAVGCAVGDQ